MLYVVASGLWETWLLIFVVVVTLLVWCPVMRLESSNPEHGPRYVVHCVQSVPEQSFKSTQFDKHLVLPEHGSTTLSFSVIVRSFIVIDRWQWFTGIMFGLDPVMSVLWTPNSITLCV